MTIHIRPLRLQDRSQWLEMWRGYQAFYGVDLEKHEEWLWHTLLQPPPEGPHGLVAADGDGRLLGLTHFLFHGTSWSPEPRCYLNDLYTREEARGQGVGRALIEAVYQAADEKGASQVYWLTQDFNEPARLLYDKVAKLTPFIKYSR